MRCSAQAAVQTHAPPLPPELPLNLKTQPEKKDLYKEIGILMAFSETDRIGTSTHIRRAIKKFEWIVLDKFNLKLLVKLRETQHL